jgi:HAD superfamily hydrolase (TIGR01459 family)
MSAPHLPQGLSDVADLYDALLCDVWGVIHNGREAFPAACEALAWFQRERGPVVLISNSPRPADDVVSQLRGLGVPDSAWAGFVTSGDATRLEISARAPGPAWAIGPARDLSLYAGTGVQFAETPEQAAFVSCTGLFDDAIETPEDYRSRLEVCARRDLVMICANPDKIVQRGDTIIYCGGALADLYVELGGAVIMSGKPYEPIYDMARVQVNRLVGRDVATSKILAIGDGMPTDVAGANNQGLPLMFIAGGIHASDILNLKGEIDPERLAALFAREDARADYAMADLRW